MSVPPWAAACLAFIAAATVPATTTQAASPALQEAFGWLEAAGPPSARGLQPVEVWTGHYGVTVGEDGTRQEHALTLPAFLVSQEADAFQVRTLGGKLETFKTSDQPANPRHVRFEPRSFEWMVEGHFGRGGHRHALFRDDEPVPSGLLQQVILARHCRDIQAEGLLKRLEDEIEQQLQKTDRNHDGLLPKEQLTEDTARYLLQHAVLALGSASNSWADIRQRLEHVVKILPHTTSAPKARLLADRVTEFMEEERARPLLSHQEIIKLPVEQQAAEQVRRLRTQMMLVSEDPNMREGDNVVEELVKLGNAAVPALIAAVDDCRPARNVYFGQNGWDGLHRDGQFSSVGELALDALGKISGRLFVNRGEADVFATPGDTPGALRQEIEAWWAGHQAKGGR